jgi:hypothetical protein
MNASAENVDVQIAGKICRAGGVVTRPRGGLRSGARRHRSPRQCRWARPAPVPAAAVDDVAGDAAGPDHHEATDDGFRNARRIGAILRPRRASQSE